MDVRMVLAKKYIIGIQEICQSVSPTNLTQNCLSLSSLLLLLILILLLLLLLLLLLSVLFHR